MQNSSTFTRSELDNQLATSTDVALLAGVSQSAVSRSFTEGASVSKRTREKVMAAAQALSYRPNGHARSLSTGQSRIIGLVLSQIDNLFYPQVVQELSAQWQAKGYHLLIFNCDDSHPDRLVEEALHYRVDGIVLAAATLSSALTAQCQLAQIPVVLFNRVIKTLAPFGIGSVRSTNERGGRIIGRFLSASDHKRIAYLAGSEDTSTNTEREAGFQLGLADYAKSLCARAVGNYEYEQTRRVVRQLFSNTKNRPDALFAASDYMAIAAMDVIRFEFGLQVPHDVSVIGFDNTPQSAWASYQLTTYEQPIAPMVEASVNLMQQLMTKRKVLSDQPAGRTTSKARIIDGHFIERQSTRALKKSIPKEAIYEGI
jgi:DNA-binding LacI/PurR family transcriptional regulator